ncbi:hypothetical protein [Paludisphaera rhizosphaerae]|uniref:hypothetical protein n=1 Tax=Paludisphaera rhizosphaerae TaxID=2711216 RepID=UPI0013E9B043|nr:hypothetical protein [Paludisphaera rhizosphaerae]
MAEMTPGAALRQLKQAHATLKKARQALRMARENPAFGPKALDAGWDALMQAHALMAAVPRSAVDEDVLTQQLSVQRYATSLLVRLRRLLRKGEVGDDVDDEGDDDE